MDTGTGDGETLRRLEPHWNHGMIVASIAISLLGAFTSTQLLVSSLRSPSTVRLKSDNFLSI
jgi:hypothetical protein